MKHRLIFSREIFYVTLVLCFNGLWLKAVNEITAKQRRTSLRKLVLPTFKSWTVHKIIEIFTVRTIVLAFEISITVHQLTFLNPPCTYICMDRWTDNTKSSCLWPHLLSGWRHNNTKTFHVLLLRFSKDQLRGNNAKLYCMFSSL